MTQFLQQTLRRPLLWVIALFILLPVVAFWEILFGGHTLYLADISWIHYPRHIFAAEEWLAGRIPLWDPYQHNGLPFLAETQVGALYPFSVLFLSSISPSLELSLFVVLHVTLAALFTFLLARLLTITTAGAVIAGLSFGMGGFLMAQITNLNIMTGAVWLPLILYGVIQTTQRRTWLAAMLAGIPLAFQIFTAQPQIVFYTWLIVGGYALYKIIADAFTRPVPSKQKLLYTLQTFFLVGLTLMTGLLLAAPQLLPTLELQQLSVRSEERAWDFLTNNSLPPALLLNLLIPGAFGNNVTGFNIGDPFQEDFVYAGFIPLLLAFFGWGQRRKPDMPFFLIVLAGGIVMALGRYTPLYHDVIQYLPGFGLFRIPARWLMAVNLSLAVLAGFGLDTLRERGVSKRQWVIILSAGVVLLAGVALIWQFGPPLQHWSSNRWSSLSQKLLEAFLNKAYSFNPVYQNRFVAGGLTVLTTPVLLFAINIIVTVSLVGLYAFRKVSANSFSLLIITAISLDMVAAGGIAINPIKPDNWWHQLSGGAKYVLAHTEQARVFPLGMGSEQATVSHLGQYFPSVYRVRSAGGHGSSLMLNRTHTFLKKAHPVQAIQALGVRFLLTEGQMGADTAATFPPAFNNGTSFVYENKTPLPRAFVVHYAIAAGTPDEAMAYFETANLDVSQTVVLETESSPPLPKTEPAAKSSAVITYEDTQTVQIDVESATGGYLVLLDTYYPGWQATLNAQPVPIYRANFLSRAVFVPDGRHTIQFTYKPLSFKIGAWLCVFTAMALAVAALANSLFNKQ